MKLTNIAKGVLRSKLLGKPFYAHLYITRRCNLTCKMCNVWRHGSKEDEMEIDDLKRVCDTFKNLGITSVVITGGEPFLRDDLPEIIRMFSETGFLVRLQTNGSRLVTERRLKEVADAGLDLINISLDSLDPDKHDYICNSRGLWRYVVDNIERSVSILSNKAVNVATTISNHNIEELPDIVSFVDNLGASPLFIPIMLSEVMDKDAPYRAFSEEMSINRLDKAIVKDVFSKLIQLKKKNVKIGMSDKFLRAAEGFLLTGNMKWKCDAGLLYFAVYPNGLISPCSEVKPVGNILRDDFTTLFRRQSYRRQMKQISENCAGCIHGCWREISYLMHDNSVLRERIMSLLSN